MSTSILKYFKPLEKTPSNESTNKVLLDPKGPLSKVLLTSAIKMVNDEVSKVQEMGSSAGESIANKREKYLTLTPAQRFEVGNLRELLSTVSPLR